MKIVCIGNITYDFSVSMEGFIKEGTRNNFSDATICPGGPACNAAYLLAKYENSVDLYGKVGKDPTGHFIYNKLLDENINIKHVDITDNVTTPYSFIINNELNSTRTICAVRSKEEFKRPIIENVEYDKDYDYILTDGKYFEESIRLMENNTSAKAIIDAGRVSNDMLMLCNFADYIICSEDFANEVTGRIISNNELENVEIYKELKTYFPFAEELVITIGEKGYICEKNDDVITMPAYKSDKKSIDTTGAGDIFHGAFTHALANGHDFYESLEFANITAQMCAFA